MRKNLSLISISEVFNENFLIPSYQRGYRWEKQQVIDLLEDIYVFARSKSKGTSSGEFYCLQPIVVQHKIWKVDDTEVELEGWEVADGQQRLTTIRIILQFQLKKHLTGKEFEDVVGKDVFKLFYETRSNAENFITNTIHEPTDDIDFYFISKAYGFIEEWFKIKIEEGIKPAIVYDSILNPLIYDEEDGKQEGVVKIIWYELDATEPAIDSFIRINLGKIPLTNAELIKALILQKRNFGNDEEMSNLRQIEIASKWNRIESALNNNEIWYLINKNDNKIATRIDLLFSVLKNQALENEEDDNLEKLIGNDNYSSFRYFQHLIGSEANFAKIKETWDSLENLFNTIEEWHSNPEWYHYIGYLIYEGFGINKLFNVGSNCVTKSDYTIELKKLIKDSSISKIKWKQEFKEINNENEVEKPYFLLDVNYNSGLERKILLLYNLEYIVKKSKSKNLIYKFPFEQFKNEDYDVEHIDSATENNLSKHEDQKVWLNVAINDLQMDKESELYFQIQDFLNRNLGDFKFDYLHEEVKNIAGEEKNSDEVKNGLGNLTLLDAETNRAYKNALFITKRRTVIEKDKKGVFVPICTKNVFLKYFDLSGTSKTKWTNDDIKNYREDIEKTLEDFLPTKPELK